MSISTEQNERRLAVLIGTDDVSPKHIKHALDEVSDMRITTYKRTYGDQINNEKRSWENVLLDWPVNPIQQYSYTTGKNATDSAMVIDAMDILYSGNIDGFYLVSNDSDFTKLAQRLKETGVFVVGIGEQKTPRPLRAAYDTSKPLEIISSDDTPEASVIENQKTVINIDEIQEAITKLLIENDSQNQSTILAKVGNFLTERFSDFDVGNCGYSKLSIFLENLNDNDFQVVEPHGSYFVQEKSASIPKTEIEKEITRITKGYNERVDNLSIIHDKPKKTYPPFDMKQYGFSHISSFIRSFGTFRIRDNMVQFK